MLCMTDVRVMFYTSLDVVADVISQGCDGCNAFVTDVIVTYIAVADVNHII